MRYVFKILVLGEPRTTIDYLTRFFQEFGERKENYIEWYKEVNAFEDICDLEVVCLTNIISADLDQILPTVDGVIYFVNPLKLEEFELFEMLLPIINSVLRNIPLIINFYEKDNILPFTVNKFLESVWLNYPDLEAFINLSPNEFHQTLECLSLAMIAGDTPLNIENAWMRFPIFIYLANKYYNEKKYFEAALSMKKASTISEIYSNNEFFIHCEQAAFLFSKINLFLEASNILNKFDKKKAKNFKELYHKVMIKEGNKLFKDKDFEVAGAQYERAAQWALIELDDKNVIIDSFKLAINSWISACKCDKAFRVLERLPHDAVIAVLTDVSDKIVKAAEYLTSIGNLESARDQLYYSVNTYQKEGLFDELKKFTNKLITILIKIIDKSLVENDSYKAKKAYDEIENIWEAYELDKINLDKILEKLIKMFLEELNFSVSSILINNLSSLKLKKELTEYSIKIEEKNKSLKKQEIKEKVHQGIEILNIFFNEEQNIIADLNAQKINVSNDYIKQNEFLKASTVVKDQANYLKNIGMEDLGDKILTKSLDILIDANIFETFFNYYLDLSEDMKKIYLVRSYPVFFSKMKELKLEKNYKKKENIFETAIKDFRNVDLYDESKEISRLFIKEIKKEALKIVKKEENDTGIEKAIELIKKVDGITSAYLEKDTFKITFNTIYQKIAEIYIKQEKFSMAQTFNEKIENIEFKTETHKKLAKLEADKSGIKSKEAADLLKGEILKEQLSYIQKKGRDAKQDQESELKQRKGLKKAYYNEALEFLKKKEYDNAIESYKNCILRLNKIKKYNLANITLAFVSLLFLKEDKINEMKKFLKEVKSGLSTSEKLFTETFSVILIEYILDLKKYRNEEKLKEAISYIENLPLFEEELTFLYEYLGKKYEKGDKSKKSILSNEEIAKIKTEVEKIANMIEKEKQDISRRKMMKNSYWIKALDELNSNNLQNAYSNYLDVVPKLVNKKFYKHAAIGLILGAIIQINTKDIQTAKSNFKNNIKFEPEILAEFQIIDHLFLAYQNENRELINFILNILIEKLILFDPEIKFLKSLLREDIISDKIGSTSTLKSSEELSKISTQLDYIFDKLQQKVRDIKGDINDLFTKRKAMKKRLYDDILNYLKSESFLKAAEKYIETINKLLKRNDLDTSSFLILLHGLTLLKSEKSIKQINSNIKKLLESLGSNKKLIEDSYYVMLLLLILDAKINKFEDYIPKIEELLKILPLFEEEKVLIKIS